MLRAQGLYKRPYGSHPGHDPEKLKSIIKDPYKFNEGFPPGHSRQTAGQLKVEEKFDTYLDLQDVCDWVTACRDQGRLIVDKTVTKCDVNSGAFLRQLEAAGITSEMLDVSCVTPLLPALLIKSAINQAENNTNMRPKDWHAFQHTVRKAAETTLRTQLEHFLTAFSPTYQSNHRDILDMPASKFNNLPKLIQRFQCIRMDMYRILSAYKSVIGDKTYEYVDGTKVENVKGYIVQCRSLGGCTLRITPFVTILQAADGCFAMNGKLLLLTVNKLIEFGNICLYLHLSAGSSLPDDCLANYIRWSNCVCTVFQNAHRPVFRHEDVVKVQDPYSLTKAMEALGVSILIRRNDWVANWDNDKLQKVTWKALVDDGVVPNQDFLENPLGRIMDALSDEEITEFIGTVKVFGHPTIYVEEGLKKLSSRVHNDLPINPALVESVVCQLKKDLFFGYFRVHKRYPEFSTTTEDITPLIRLLRQGQDPTHTVVSKKWREIPLDAWKDITIEKTAEFEIIDNQISLIKDKAIGLTRDKVFQQILRDSGDTSRSLTQRVESKALLAYLLEPYFDKSFIEYMQRYISTDFDDWSSTIINYLVIKLTPKELELKPEGRMFGQSPPEERSRRINQEWITMKLLDKYFPDQMLTPDELTTIKRLYSFRALRRLYPDHLVLQVSFDFSRWNNNFRHESVDVVAEQVLDKFFGVSLWSKTMRAFQRMLVYYTDKYRTISWDGQQGGIEGLNQATWSLVFLAGIKYALGRTAKIFQVTVKGDDVRAAIVVPGDPTKMTAEALQEHRDRILENMRAVCSELGWVLNAQECFVSLSLIASSKQYQVHECWLPSSCKKMMKIESLTNAIFPTAEDVISTIFSNCHSACSQTTNITPAYSTAVFIAARTLLHEMKSWNETISEDELAMLLMWPQILGGPGSLPLQVFFVRGENDMLSVSISLLRHILLRGPRILPVLAERILRQGWKRPLPIQLLISDPYGLPLNCPDRPDQILRRQLKNTMKFWVRNKRLMPIVSVQTDRDSEKFQQTLLTMNPYCAKIATALWESSVFFLKEEVLAKFSSSATVFQFLTRVSYQITSVRSAYKILNLMLSQAKERKIYWVHRIKGRAPMTRLLLGVHRSTWTSETICTTQITHEIRSQAWNRKIVGLTYPSVVDQFKLVHHEDYHLFGLGFIEISNAKHEVNYDKIKFQTTIKPSHHYSAVQGVTPWVGSKTTPSATLQGFEEGTSSPTISKIKRLIVIAQNRGTLGDDIYKICQDLASAVTDLDLSDVLQIAAVSGGGHVAHRVPINAFSLVTMPNHRPNRAQIVEHMTDQMQLAESDGHRRTINYACYRYIVTILATFDLEYRRMIRREMTGVMRSSLHWNEPVKSVFSMCDWCNNVVDDPHITIDMTHMPDLSRYRTVHMLGCSPAETEMLYSNVHRAATEKIRKMIRSDEVDTSNPIVMTAASLIYLHNLSAEGRSVSAIRNTMELKFISDPFLLPSLAAITGQNDLAIYDPSDLMIRAIPPEVLYDSLRQHVFFNISFEIMDVAMSRRTSAELNWASITAKLYAIFEKLINAGGVYSLMLGYKSFVEKQSRGEQVNFCLSVHQATDVRACLRKFVTSHISLFANWLMHGNCPPRYKPFVHLQSAESIQSELGSMFQNFMRLLARKLESTRCQMGVIEWFYDIVLAEARSLDLSLEDVGSDTFDALEPDQIEPYEGLIHSLLDFCRPDNFVQPQSCSARPYDLLIQLWLVLTIPACYHCVAETSDGHDLTDATTDVVILRRADDQVGWDHCASLQSLADKVEYINDLITLYGRTKMLVVLNITRAMVDKVTEVGFTRWGHFHNWHSKVQDTLNGHLAFERLYSSVRVTCMSKLDVKRILKDKGDLVRQCDALLRGLAESTEWRTHQLESHTAIQWCDNPRHISISPLMVLQAPPQNDAFNNAIHKIIVDLNHTGALAKAHGRTLLTPSCRAYIYGYQNFTGARFLFHTRFFGLWSKLKSSNDNIFMTTIGDGTGSMSLLFMLQSERIKNYYCSLQLEPGCSQYKRDFHPLQTPLGLLNAQTDLSSRVIWFGNFPGDITIKEVCASILHSIGTMSSGNDIVVFEAEFPLHCTEEYITTCYLNFLKLVYETLRPNGLAVIKIQLLHTGLAIRWMYTLLLLFADHHVIYSADSLKVLRYVTLTGSNINPSVSFEMAKSWITNSHPLPYHTDASTFIEEFFHDFIETLRSNLSLIRQIAIKPRHLQRIPPGIVSPVCPLELLLHRLFPDFSMPQLEICQVPEYVRRYCNSILIKWNPELSNEALDLITGMSIGSISADMIPRTVIAAFVVRDSLNMSISSATENLSQVLFELLLSELSCGLLGVLTTPSRGSRYSLLLSQNKWHIVGIDASSPAQLKPIPAAVTNDVSKILQEVYNICLRMSNWYHTILDKFLDDEDDRLNSTLVPNLLTPSDPDIMRNQRDLLNVSSSHILNYEVEIGKDFIWGVARSRSGDDREGDDIPSIEDDMFKQGMSMFTLQRISAPIYKGYLDGTIIMQGSQRVVTRKAWMEGPYMSNPSLETIIQLLSRVPNSV